MRSVNALPRLGLAAFLVLAVVANAQAAIYYVNPTGNDANAGTSAAPFQTIKRAAEVIQNGDTVYVGPGTYSDDIFVNGVQSSSLPATFIGNNGAIVNASWKVINSNYVQIKNFAFQGTTTRFLVWKGSYEGLIEDCEFTAGDEGLLIKSGSLTINQCLIEDFAHDGIQVDGEADLLIANSTISGCQESAIEIRKVAHVELDTCTVDGNVGNGVEVAITADEIDEGDDGNDDSNPGAGLLIGVDSLDIGDTIVNSYDSNLGPYAAPGNDNADVRCNGDIAIGGGFIHGDAWHGPARSVDPSKVSGTVTELPDPIVLPSIDFSGPAASNDNAIIPLTQGGADPMSGTELTVSGGDILDLPPGTFYFTKFTLSGGAQMQISGATVIYLNGKGAVSGGSIANPMQKAADLKFFVGEELKLSGDSELYAALYGPDAKIEGSGSSQFRGMMIGKQIKLGGGGTFHVDEALGPWASTLTGIASGGPSTPSPPGSWTPPSSGELNIGDSTLSNNANAVLMVTPQAFTATWSEFSNNGWGLRLNESFDVRNCTFNSNTAGGLWLTGLTDADVQVVNLSLYNNALYGVYAESCNLTFDAANIGDWSISGSPIAVVGVDSDLTFENVTITGVQLSQGTMSATGTTFSGSGYGLAVDDADVTLTGCTLSGNTVGLYANQNAIVAVTGTSISNNSSYGIHSNNSSLTLSGLTVSGSSTAAVHAVGGDLTVSNSTLSGSGYGIWAGTADAVVIDTCTLSGNTTGLYADQNTSVLVNNSTFTGSTQWGASVSPKTTAGLSVTFDACTFDSNAGGVALVNAVDGQVSLQNGTLIRDNTNSGLHFENCNLAINDQSGGTAWRTLRNGYGISSNGSTLTISGVSVEESSQYGVFCEGSSVSLADCTVTGVGGLYADAANNSLTVVSTTLDATSAGGWGLARYGGDLEVKNTVMNGFDGGVFLFTASGDQAAVKNSTLVNLANYGVYLSDGAATVQNTVLVGGSGAQGLTQVSGLLTHSYNLLHGFGTPFSGTVADASELLENPRFVDAAGGDFRLAKGSPAINAGADLSVSGVTIDMLGNTRPSHKVFEIGAYEYMQDDGSLRILHWKEER